MTSFAAGQSPSVPKRMNQETGPARPRLQIKHKGSLCWVFLPYFLLSRVSSWNADQQESGTPVSRAEMLTGRTQPRAPSQPTMLEFKVWFTRVATRSSGSTRLPFPRAEFIE